MHSRASAQPCATTVNVMQSLRHVVLAAFLKQQPKKCWASAAAATPAWWQAGVSFDVCDAAYSTSEAPRTTDQSSSASTSTEGQQQQPSQQQGKQTKKSQQPGKQQVVPLAAASASTSQDSDTQPAPSSFNSMALVNQSRYTLAYQQILFREMMLKTSPNQWTSVPRLKSVTLTITASDTRLERQIVPFADMLLYQLALEMISGQPATFIEPRGQTRMGKAEGVKVQLTGEPMMDFLEKLVYMVLPNMIGFEGASHPKAVPTKPSPASGQPGKEQKDYFSDFKVTNLMLFPDFEQEFDLFEQLRGMEVRLEVEGAQSAEMAGMFLGGFALPVRPADASEPVSEQPRQGFRGSG